VHKVGSGRRLAPASGETLMSNASPAG